MTSYRVPVRDRRRDRVSMTSYRVRPVRDRRRDRVSIISYRVPVSDRGETGSLGQATGFL
jgi:hypothetical protein